MKQIQRILVPTDLSEHSRRGLTYACSLATENKANLVVLHVANAFELWQLYADELSFYTPPPRSWPLDRVLSEASLDLNRFLEPHLESMKQIPSVSKRLALGPIPDKIALVAQEENADLIVMSPRRARRFGHLFTPSITDRVMRMSPCPVLSCRWRLRLRLRPWRGKLTQAWFGWPGQRMAST